MLLLARTVWAKVAQHRGTATQAIACIISAGIIIIIAETGIAMKDIAFVQQIAQET